MCPHFSAIPQILLSQWNPSIYCIMHTPTFLFVNQALWPILLDGNVCDSVVKVLFVWFSFKRSLHLNGNYCKGRKFGFCFANVFSFRSSIIYNSLNLLEVQFGSFFFFKVRSGIFHFCGQRMMRIDLLLQCTWQIDLLPSLRLLCLRRRATLLMQNWFVDHTSLQPMLNCDVSVLTFLLFKDSHDCPTLSRSYNCKPSWMG